MIVTMVGSVELLSTASSDGLVVVPMASEAAALKIGSAQIYKSPNQIF